MCKNLWLERYVELTKIKKAAEKELSELKEKISSGFNSKLEEMNGKYHVEKSGYSITYQIVSQKKFDSTTFKQNHRDLYEKYKKESSYKKLEIKKIENPLGIF